MYLPNNIRFLRKSKGLSQDDLADFLGYKSFTTIQKWESGIAEPSILVLHKMADYFGIDINSLVYEDLEAADASSLVPRQGECPEGYSRLDDMDKAKVDGFVQALLMDEKYKKDTKSEAM